MTVTNLNILRANATNDNSCLTPKDVLESCLEDIENGDEYESIVVLKISQKGGYGVGWSSANLKCSEMIAVSEVFKQMLLNSMGYSLAPEDIEVL